jgi:hypothetical protein
VSDAREVAVRLSVLPERRMREAKLGDIVQSLPPGEAAWLLDALATAGRGGGPPFDLSLLAAVDLSSGDRLPYDTRRAIFEAAEACGLHSCKELLLTVEDVDDERAARPRALLPGTRPLTLGERKALARSWRRDVIERLVTDPHTDVVALLLGNPHVTEDDILRIATARRSSAAVLNLVLQSRRFATSPRVRRALVRNPKLPVASAPHRDRGHRPGSATSVALARSARTAPATADLKAAAQALRSPVFFGAAPSSISRLGVTSISSPASSRSASFLAAAAALSSSIAFISFLKPRSILPMPSPSCGSLEGPKMSRITATMMTTSIVPITASSMGTKVVAFVGLC